MGEDRDPQRSRREGADGRHDDLDPTVARSTAADFPPDASTAGLTVSHAATTAAVAGLRTAGDAAAPTQTAAAASGSATFGEYELLEEIARGGMGVVFRARQNRLNRIVALKMILAGELAGQEEVERFYREASAAAQLDHAHIVPVFEVGQCQGRHYFSMGFVEGESLDQRLKREGPLSPPQAARLLATIAEAIAYAHEQGVIHRDLKPANILLQRSPAPRDGATATRDADGLGQPRVSDFGLAKQLGAPGELTGSGKVLGTPGYMPPEQAAGQSDRIGVAADVYSLGAVLYAALTARPPFQAASLMETLQLVIGRDPVSPSQLNPHVPQDLETICLKCLEKEPEKRYASAAELAEELGRFLRNEPIRARPIGAIQRLVRWRRRNPAKAALAATAAALLLLLAVGGPVVAIQQASLRDAAQRERDNYRAELHQHREALGDYVAAIGQSELLRQPEFTPLKQELLDSALAHYRNFISRHRDDPAFAAETAEAMFSLGDVCRQTHGMEAEAVTAFQDAIELSRSLAELEPDQLEHRRRLARSCVNLGHAYADLDRQADAVASYEAARDAFQEIVDRGRDPSANLDLGVALNSLGAIRLELGDPEIALRQFEQTLAGFADAENLTPFYQEHLATAHHNLGAAYQSLGRSAEALESRRQAVQLRQRLVDDAVLGNGVRNKLNDSRIELARDLRLAGRLEESEGLLQEAIADQAETVDENPTLAEPRLVLGNAYAELARVRQAEGSLDGALTAQSESVETLRKLAGMNAGNVRAQDAFGRGLSEWARLWNESGDKNKARELLVESLRAMSSVQQGGAISLGLARRVAETHSHIATTHTLLGDYAAAQPIVQQAIDLQEQLIARHGEQAGLRRDLAESLNQMGLVQSRLVGVQEAMSSFQRALTMLEELSEQHPENESHRAELSTAYNNMGLMYRQVGDRDAALRMYLSGLRLQQELLARRPDDRGLRMGLAEQWMNLGVLYKRTFTDYQKSLECYQEALSIWEELGEDPDDDLRRRAGLAAIHNNIGNVRHSMQELEEAESSYLSALGVLESLVQDEPDSLTYRSDLAGVRRRLARLYQERGDFALAHALHDQILQSARELTERSPQDIRLRSELAESLVELGVLFLLQDNRQEALRVNQEAGDAFDNLVKDHPQLTDIRDALAVTRYNVGSILSELGRPAEAVRSFTGAGREFEEEWKLNPAVRAPLESAVMAFYNAASQAASEPADAKIRLEAAEHAQRLIKQLASDGALAPPVRAAATQLPRILAQLYEDVGDFQAAAEAWFEARRWSQGERAVLYGLRESAALSQAGDHVAAGKKAMQFGDLVKPDVNAYNLACVLALAAQATADSPDDAQENSAEWRRMSLRILERLGEAGYFDHAARSEQAGSDPRLQSLRDDPAFPQAIRAANPPRAAGDDGNQTDPKTDNSQK